jgi:hypothetical protein
MKPQRAQRKERIMIRKKDLIQNTDISNAFLSGLQLVCSNRGKAYMEMAEVTERERGKEFKPFC